MTEVEELRARLQNALLDNALLSEMVEQKDKTKTEEHNFSEKLRVMQNERDQAIADATRIERMRLQDNKEAAEEMQRVLAEWEKERQEMRYSSSHKVEGFGGDEHAFGEHKHDTYMHRAYKMQDASCGSYLQECASYDASELHDGLAEEASLLAKSVEADKQLRDRLWTVLATNRALSEAFSKTKDDKSKLEMEAKNAMALARSLQAELDDVKNSLHVAEQQRDEAKELLLLCERRQSRLWIVKTSDDNTESEPAVLNRQAFIDVEQSETHSLHLPTTTEGLTQDVKEHVSGLARAETHTSQRAAQVVCLHCGRGGATASGGLCQDWAMHLVQMRYDKRRKSLTLQRWRQYARRRALMWRRAQIVGYRFYRWRAASLQHALSNWFLAVRRRTQTKGWLRRHEAIFRGKVWRGTVMRALIRWEKLLQAKDAAVESLRLKNLARFVRLETRSRALWLQIVSFRVWAFVLENRQPNKSVESLLQNQRSMQDIFERKCHFARRRASGKISLSAWQRYSTRRTSISRKMAIFCNRKTYECVKICFQCWLKKGKHSLYMRSMLSTRMHKCNLRLKRGSCEKWYAVHRQQQRKEHRIIKSLGFLARLRQAHVRSCFEAWQDYLFDQTRLVVARRPNIGSFLSSANLDARESKTPSSPLQRLSFVHEGQAVTVSHISSPEWTESTGGSPRHQRGTVTPFFRDWRDHVHHHIRRTAAAHAGVPRIQSVFGPVFPKQHHSDANYTSFISPALSSTPVDRTRTSRRERSGMEEQERWQLAAYQHQSPSASGLPSKVLGSEKRQKVVVAGARRKGFGGVGVFGETQSLHSDMLMEQERMAEVVIECLVFHDCEHACSCVIGLCSGLPAGQFALGM